MFVIPYPELILFLNETLYEHFSTRKNVAFNAKFVIEKLNYMCVNVSISPPGKTVNVGKLNAFYILGCKLFMLSTPAPVTPNTI
jgi:hypothetical protein